MVKASQTLVGFVLLALILIGLSMLTNARADIPAKCQKAGGIYVEPKYGSAVCLKPESIIEIK